MMNTLERLIDFHHAQNNNTIKSKPKAIVWAHNTHIGDARFTDMNRSGMINLGQLVREKKGVDNTVLVGFGTYSGTVIAARKWGQKMEIMNIPPAIEGRWDSLLHNIDHKLYEKKQGDKMIIFRNNIQRSDIEWLGDNASKEEYEKNRGQRAIGVVYNPIYERYSNYVPTVLSSRYDAFLFIDNTTALSPLQIESLEDKDLPETFPTGE